MVPMNRRIVVFLILFLLTGCVSTREQLKQLGGSHKNKILSQWGPPEIKKPDG